MSKPFFVCLYICLGLFSTIAAQDMLTHIQHFGIEEGLSHRSANTIMQSHNGMIWVGTQYGLNRFDGRNFKWYTKETHDLMANNVDAILEDQQSNLWLFHKTPFQDLKLEGITIFNPTTETSISFDDYFSGLTDFTSDQVSVFDRTPDGAIFLFTHSRKLIQYDEQFNSIQLIIPDNWQVQSIKKAPNDVIWVTSSIVAEKKMILSGFNLKGQLQHQFIHEGYENLNLFHFSEAGEFVYDLRTIGKLAELFVIDSVGQQSVHPSHEDAYFQSVILPKSINGKLYSTQDGKFWLYYDDKLESFDLMHPGSKNAESYFPNVKNLKAIIVDNNGMTWAATSFGIYQIQFKFNNFYQVLQSQEDYSIATRNLFLDKQDNLWIVHDGRRIIWKATLDDYKVTKLDKLFYQEVPFPIINHFIALTQGKNGNIYIAPNHLLVQFDPETHEYHVDTLTQNATDLGYIWSLYEDGRGLIWFASDRGMLGYFDGKNTKWLIPPGTESPFKCGYFFHEDKNGNTWLSTDSGLFIIDTEKGKIKARYWTGGSDAFYLPFDNIYHMHEDEDGSFWLGTGGTGLVHWSGPNIEKPDFTYEQFTRSHGLNNVIYAVYEDDYGHLWLPSDYGIIRFNKTNHHIKTFLDEDGITHNEFNRVSHHQAIDGRLFFGGLDGLTYFHPKDFLVDSTISNPPLIITNFQLIDKEGVSSKPAQQHLAEQQTIIYKPQDRFFRIEFALLSYQNVDQIQYAYKIEGIDTEWNYQKENFIRFSRLPYGKHNLRIKGQDAYGQWSNQELSVQLIIKKPVYLRSWFIATSILSTLGLILLYIRWRNYQLIQQKKVLQSEVARQTEEIRQQAEELKSLEKLKSRFFANVSHELRTPLSLMLGPLDSLINNDFNKDKSKHLLQFVYKNSKHLLKLVNEILDLSKLEKGKLEVKPIAINFHDFLKTLVAQFNSVGDSIGNKLRFNYNISKSLNLLLDINKFEKIIHNYLSNAIKFTPQGGNIDFNIVEKKGNILISVQDRGPGIHSDDLPNIFNRFYQSKKTDTPAQGGTGIGLSLCKEMAELLGGKVWAESEWGHGSTFYFQFPKSEASPEEVVPLEEVIEFHPGLAPSIESNIPNTADKVTSNTILENESSNDPLVKPNSSKEGKSTILVVEDNEDLRQYISTLLGDEYHIFTAENGLAALHTIQSLDAPISINLIISDLMMPIMDGFEFLEKVKTNDALRHIPIIMLTARADVRVKLQALRIGIDDYLVKPFIEAELKIRINNLLNNLQERILFHYESSVNDSPKAENPVIGEADANWLKEMEIAFEKIILDSKFNLDWVASQMSISKRQLQRRVKQLTGLTPILYLREMRLQKARDYIYQGKYHSVKEVAAAVGFSDTKYFSRLFQERFGVLPSERLG